MIKNKHIIKVKELLLDANVSMGTFGLIELELLAMEKELTSQLSHNSDYTASPKLPSLKEVSDYIGYMPDETMTIQATYNAIKKLGNFA